MQQKIKDITVIQIGYQFRKKLEPEIDGSHKVVQIKDIDENQNLNQKGLCRVTIDKLSEKYLILKNDILFLARGHRNYAIPVIDSMEGTIAASHFFILKIKTNNVIPEYLAWFINQAPAQEYLHNLARRGSHMPIIPKSVFENLKVHIPDIETQKKIVKLNTLIDKERTLLYNLREKRALLIRSLCLKAAKENV